MELITFEMRELKAAAGKVLTNGETFSSVGRYYKQKEQHQTIKNNTPSI